MLRLSTLVLCGSLGLLTVQAQTTDVVVFSEMGEKFTLIIDGDEKNTAPASRVVATGLKNPTPAIVVRFADAAIPPIKENAFLNAGMEYTLKITTNKKGARVLRMQGEAALGTAAAAEPARTKPANFQEDAPAGQQATVKNTTSGGGQTTTTTTTTQVTGTTGENVNMAVGVNGMGVSMNLGITDPTMAGSTTSTTTTHTTTTHTTTTTDDEPATTATEVYHMPGYSGPVGCAMPMSDGEFAEAKTSIESKGFEESKMTLAKQIGGSHCFSVAQVKGIMDLFGFEETKLDFAKFAYGHTHDIGNYYKVNDAFSFESSIDDLNKYIQSR